MQCPSCSCELLHPTNFCPTCGFRLAVPEGWTPPGQPAGPPGAPPAVSEPPATPESGAGSAQVHQLQPPADEVDNVVYLHPPGPTGLDVNPQAHRYDELVPAAGEPPIHPLEAPLAASAQGDEGDEALPSGYVWTTNVLGERVAIPETGPTGSFFEFEERQPGPRRVLGTTLALVSAAMLSVAIGVYVASLRSGTSGAIAGGFVLLWAVFWSWYLSLGTERQHDLLMGTWTRFSGSVDRHVDPLRQRTETGLVTRRERERLESMRRERARRVGELGEIAYRQFRAGALDQTMTPAAQRVVAIEQQMLMQDAKIAGLLQQRTGLHEQEPVAEPHAPRRPRLRRRRRGSRRP